MYYRVGVFILPPDNKIAEKKIEHWNFSSLFSLARNLMECYQTMFYLCVDQVSSDELNARRKLFNLHDYYSREKLFSFTSEKEDNNEIEEFVTEELTEIEYFKSFNEKQQKYFLKGDYAFFEYYGQTAPPNTLHFFRRMVSNLNRRRLVF